MSTSNAGLKNAACGRTAAWPDNNARPELQTLRGRVIRGVLLWFLFGLWIVGLASFILLWLYSCVCVLRSGWDAMLLGEWTPLPYVVQVCLMGTAMYEGYHFATRDSLRLWPFMRRVMRYVFLHYPYFRLNATVFEEREEDEIAAIEENNVAPVVKPNDRSMFAFHPHGVLSNGFAINGAHHMSFEQADCRWLVAENLFWFPVLREVLNWMDFSSVAKSTFHRFMSSGRNVCLIPGGFEEATLYKRGKHRVYIKKRFGFIKLALQHGYKVHPAYTFGEEYAYHTFPYLLQLRLKLNEFKLPGVLFYGLPQCFFLPCSDVDLITVIGEALILPRIEHPTREDVEKYHAQYVSALQGLFDRYKGVYAVDPEAELEIY